MLVLVSVLLTACSVPSSDTPDGAGADSATGPDTDMSPDTDSGADTDPDSGGDSGSDTSGDSGGPSGTPLPAYGGQFTYGGFTSTVVCGDGSPAEYACSETANIWNGEVFERSVRVYRLSCNTAGDTSGSGEMSASLAAYFFDPAVGDLTDTDILAPLSEYRGAILGGGSNVRRLLGRSIQHLHRLPHVADVHLRR
jgi:hypothetical protein